MKSGFDKNYYAKGTTMKKLLVICIIAILTLSLCACGGEENSNLADNYVDSITNFISNESGESDVNTDEHIIADYSKDDIIYTLLYSKTQSSDVEVYYLVRTMDIDSNFITDRISEDANLSDDLSTDNPYIATTMQNHAGDVFFYLVKVMDDSFHVLRDGKEAFSPRENLFVETGDTEPVLEITQQKPAE